MELAGFCRNCLSRWYREAAEERGLELERRSGARDRLRHALRGVEISHQHSRTACLTPARGLAGCGGPRSGRGGRAARPRPEEVVLTPEAARGARAARGDAHGPVRRHARWSCAGAGAERGGHGDPNADAPSPGAPTDAEVRTELREARASLTRFKQYLNTTAFLRTGPRARVLRDGTAVAPENAPEAVKRVILAANQIAKFPYKWGGGHGAWRDNGYDCSGSVSFALAGAGLLDRPLTSGLLAGYGRPGPGRWITIYANSGHVFMVVAGLRFDTSGQGRAGTRWQDGARLHRRLRRAPRPRALLSPCRAGPRPSPSAARAPSGAARRPGCELATRQPRSPLDVGNEGRAELGVGGQAGLVGGVADQAHPAPALAPR